MFEFITRFIPKAPDRDAIPDNLNKEVSEQTFQKICGEIAFIFPRFEPCTVSSGRAEEFYRAIRKIVISHNVHPLNFKLKSMERGKALEAMRLANYTRESKEASAGA